MPPPLDDRPSARRIRNQAAIAKVAGLLAVGADEIDLAARCIAIRAQAGDLLRLSRKNAAGVRLAVRMNAPYRSMLRTALCVHARLTRTRMLAMRRQRDATEGEAEQGAWSRHVAERSMLEVADLDVARHAVATFGAVCAGVPAASPGAVWPEGPADHGIAGNVPKNEMYPEEVAINTIIRSHSGNQGPAGPRREHLGEGMRRLLAEATLASQASPASGRANPGRGGPVTVSGGVSKPVRGPAAMKRPG